MTFRDFLKDLEGQKLSYSFNDSTGQHIIYNETNPMGTKCTLTNVGDDFITLDFVKTSFFDSTYTLYIPIAMIYCNFAGGKK